MEVYTGSNMDVDAKKPQTLKGGYHRFKSEIESQCSVLKLLYHVVKVFLQNICRTL